MPKKQNKTLDKLIVSLDERMKELNCLFEIEELLHQSELSADEVMEQSAKIIKTGMRYSDICAVEIVYRDARFKSGKVKKTPWTFQKDIILQDRSVGWIKVIYLEQKLDETGNAFLPEEIKTIESIAVRLSHYLMYQKLKVVFNKWETTKQDFSEKQTGEWKIILELIKRSDPDVFLRISRKMLNYLLWKGIAEADVLLQKFIPLLRYSDNDIVGEINVPLKKQGVVDSGTLAKKAFDLAAKHLSKEEILTNIQKWIQQDKTSFLVRITSDLNSSLTDISNAIRKYFQMAPEGLELWPAARIGVRAALIRRFLSEQLEFVIIAKNFLKITDFADMLHRIIFMAGSHGKLGGKSSGLFLAKSILNAFEDQEEILKNIKTPKSWYITSDSMIHFMYHNNLEEMLEQKYKTIEEVRQEYIHVVQLFKNSNFPPEIVQGLSMALDDLGDRPIIVRSSSVLEDRLGSAFSGKYKSLFLANRGTKSERLDALLDAISEVYASTLGPDPMEYRAERGLIDFHEEMGILIQEVVGTKIGDYFFPAYAGVAFSNNEFRWSPRIKREDGLIRMVPGIGTRAVDRLSDDYPLLIAPGQPGLRANVSLEDIIRYSPQKMDVIDLTTNQFVTVEIKDIIKKVGDEFPRLERYVSILKDNHLTKPLGFNFDYSNDDFILTFEGLIEKTPFVKKVHAILKTLQNALGTPVDIEFASDGEDFYLLQCRPQSYSKYDAPSPIPNNIPKENLIFTANKYISNGYVPDISFIVYVDPDGYNNIGDLSELKSVGSAISKLNQLLPKRHFILMGPGRWGSRGDIKLGVNVTYSDINNTAVLIEIARKKGNYTPDLSFGTHFFQDLVEASIRYLPLYPDNENNIFHDEFFSKSPNAIFEILPAYSNLSNVIHVIDVPSVTKGKVLRILMNADINQAVGVLGPPTSPIENSDTASGPSAPIESLTSEHWRWRMEMAEKLAFQIDANRFAVKNIFILGSTSSTRAQEGSDIDLLINFTGSEDQKKDLETWLEGWSLCLDEINYLKTGYKAGGLLDIHYVTDKELKNKEKLSEKFSIDIENMKELKIQKK
jgi:pyruvate, water dikinase